MASSRFPAILPNISEAFIKQNLSYESLVNKLRSAFTQFTGSKEPGQEGTVKQPLRAVLSNADDSGLFINMPSYMSGENVFASKLVTVYNGNAELPSHQGVILLFDSTNGSPLAMMGAEEITAKRTAAASVLSSLYLASSSVSTLAILGAGTQAESHIDGHLSLMPQLKSVNVWNKSQPRAEKLIAEMRQKWAASGVMFQICGTIQETVSNADIVCTVTSATTPILDGEWMKKPGVHVNAVGAPRSIWRELEDNVLTNSFLVADSRESAQNESGDVVHSGKCVDAELGEIITGKVTVDREQRTVFKSLGIAIEDLVAAKLVFEAYKKEIS